jgi:class 3 adenylate cyclase
MTTQDRTVEVAQRRLASIMFTDMVGYSAVAQRDEALALELVRQQDERSK